MKIVTTLVVLLLSIPICAYSVEVDGINYQFDSRNLTATVVQLSTKYSGDITIPETVDYKNATYTVSTIGLVAFRGNDELTSVTLPSSITSIESYAFEYCFNLKKINLPEGLQTIGNNAFSFCSGLTELSFPQSIQDIGFAAFSSCEGLTSIVLPDNLLRLRNGVFSFCSGLKSVVFGKNLTSIGSSTFVNCTSLECISIPSSVTFIGETAFANCTALLRVDMGECVASIGMSAFSNCTALESISIDSVHTIGASAFTLCTSLKSITIQAASVGQCAFGGCSNLKDVVLGEKVQELDFSIFQNCRMLSSLEVSPSNPYFSSCNGALHNKSQTTLIFCLSTVEGDYKVLDSVTTLGKGAFMDCDKLNSISLGDAVSSIEDNVFYGCTALSSIEVASSNANYCSIDGVLYSKNLETVVCCPPSKPVNNIFWDKVTNIASGAFAYSREIKNISFPTNITSIGNLSFAYCPNLTTVVMSDELTSIGGSAFKGCPALRDVTLPGNLSELPAYCFSGCSALRSISLPNSIEIIRSAAFRDCLVLERVNCFAEVPPTVYDSPFASTVLLMVPYGCVDAYRSVYLWSEIENILEMEQGADVSQILNDERNEDLYIYDISGRRVKDMSRRGIYIVNGKKVMIR